MKKTLTGTRVRHQGIKRETELPKDLRHIYSGEAQRRRLQGLHQMPAHPPGDNGEKAVENTIRNLEGLRTRFTAEIARFRWIYDGGWEKKVLLINVRMAGSRKLLSNQVWLTRGEWTQHLGVGDFISFDARIKNGKLLYPTNAALIKAGASTSNPQATAGTGIQMEFSF